MLRSRQSLCSGFLKPMAGAGIIFRHTMTLVIQQTKALLCGSIALSGRFFIPLAGTGIIPGYT